MLIEDGEKAKIRNVIYRLLSESNAVQNRNAVLFMAARTYTWRDRIFFDILRHSTSSSVRMYAFTDCAYIGFHTF
jgi:hypothetical protein